MTEQRDQIKTDLEKKEKELHLFRLQAQSQKDSMKWQGIIERKEAEVCRLRSHMNEVEGDLCQAKEEHVQFLEQLRRSTAQLTEDCERVRILENSRAELERERRQVDTKLKMEIAKSEGMELPKSDEASTFLEMDSLKQDVQHRLDTKHQLKESSARLKELTRDRDNTKRELEEKEEELALLQLGGQQQIDDESIQSAIADKKEEIQDLKHEVTRVERELSQARDAQVARMTEQRDHIKENLEKKEKELQIFRLQAQSQKHNMKWQGIIERKEDEVGRLRIHMNEVEGDLCRAKEEHVQFRQQLRRATGQLTENCERVRVLEKSRAELERERSRVDTKLKMEIAHSEGVELSNADGAGTVQQVDSLKQDIHERDEEIRQLTCLLETREDVAEGCGGGGGVGESSPLEVEASDVRAKLEEEKDKKMKAEEELKNLQKWKEETSNLQGIPDPQKCTAVFPHSRPTTGSNTAFEVHLKDARGEPCHITSDVNVTAQLTSLVDGSTTDTTLESHTLAPSTLSYKPTQRGRHHLTVSVNGEAVAGTPSPLCVSHPPAQLGPQVRAIEGIYRPWRVAITSNEHLVVTESESISVCDVHGKLIKKIGSLEDGQQRVNFNPTGVVVGNDNVLFVADCTSHRLLKMSCDGELLKAVGGRGAGPGQFDQPDGVTLISTTVYICDMYNDRVQMFDAELNLLGFFGTGGSGEGQFDYPRDISAGRDECLYVADRGNHRVQVFSQSGSFLHSFGSHGSGPGQLASPIGIHVRSEFVYVVDNGNARVSVFILSGEFVSSFVVGQGRNLMGITTDSDGYLYVIDFAAGRIHVY